MTRPDIASALRACARHSNNPSPRHWKALFQIAEYVNATTNIGLRFARGSGLRLSVYAYADYAAASNDQRSVSGAAGILGDTAIGWKSSTQKCVTTATCEVEYVALCDASKEALFTRAALVFLQSELSGMRVEMFGDNKGAKAIADNSSSSASSSKHIEVKLHSLLYPTTPVLVLFEARFHPIKTKESAFFGAFFQDTPKHPISGFPCVPTESTEGKNT